MPENRHNAHFFLTDGFCNIVFAVAQEQLLYRKTLRDSSNRQWGGGDVFDHFEVRQGFSLNSLRRRDCLKKMSNGRFFFILEYESRSMLLLYSFREMNNMTTNYAFSVAFRFFP